MSVQTVLLYPVTFLVQPVTIYTGTSKKIYLARDKLIAIYFSSRINLQNSLTNCHLSAKRNLK